MTDDPWDDIDVPLDESYEDALDDEHDMFNAARRAGDALEAEDWDAATVALGEAVEAQNRFWQRD